VIDLIDHSSDSWGILQFTNLFALLEPETVEDLSLMAVGLRATAMKTDGYLSHV